MISYRIATTADLDDLCRIEDACFAYPWNREMLQTELAMTDSVYWLQLQDDTVCGYYSYMHVLDEAHILNIAVLPAFRGRGLGYDMIRHLLSALPPDVGSVTLEVRVGNARARHIYEQAGFVLAGVRKGYYPDREDAAIYWWTKGE